MSFNTVEEIENEIAKLEEIEELNQKRLETFVSKQYQLQAMLKNVTKSIPRLQEVSVDAEKLSEVIKQTASLAECVSEKVRRLDITRSRVSECQQRVHDLLDLQLCSEGVQTALKNEDYEKAAGHVHRFLSIDQNLLKRTADNFAEDKTNLNNSFVLLQEVTEKLREVVSMKINEAIINEDLASVERFFKIYPLLNLHKEGIIKYASYLSKKLQETAKVNLKTALNTNKVSSNNIIFADTLNSLLEGTAQIIETCQPLIETYYGPGKMLHFIAQLQTTCDSEGEAIITELVRSRELDKKKRLVNEYQSSTKTIEKIDAKALSILLTELTNMHEKINLYFKFLKRRSLHGLEEGTELYINTNNEVNVLIEKKCRLNQKMQDIFDYYVLLERYFMEENVSKAISMDSPQDGEDSVSTMVDDVFFIVRKSILRACSSGSLEGVCTILNHVSRLLETEYCPAIKQQLRQGYSSGYLDIDLTQAYTALQQGRLQASDPEQTKLVFLCHLNNSDVSMEYTEKLKETIQAEIQRAFPKATDKEKEKVAMCLSGLTDVSAALSCLIDYGMKQLKQGAISPRVNSWIKALLDHNHEMTEDDFNNYDAGDTFIQQLIAHIDGFLSSFKTTLTQNNYNTMVNVLATEIAHQLEKVVLKGKYSRYGGLVIDRELRYLITFLASLTSWSVREKFSRLLKITALLNLERLSDISGLEDITKSGVFQPTEIQKILRRRTDFNNEDIDSLKFV